MKQAAYIFGLVFVFATLYVVSYYAMVDRTMDYWGHIGPTYRAGGELSNGFYSLWHECDRKLRPDYWSCESFFSQHGR